MISKPPRVLAMHDLTGVGRCALTLVIPILSSMGVQVCPVSTAVLSTHPGGFGSYKMRAMTEEMKLILSHYSELSLEFSGIYTGFLGEGEQVDLISGFISSLSPQQRGLVLIDPVFGDNGKIYVTQPLDIVEKMKKLVRHADIITPNTTEAAFLIDLPPLDRMTTEEVKKRLMLLSDMGIKKTVITGVNIENNDDIYSCGYDSTTGEFVFAASEHVEGNFHGTGDTFASVLLGALLRGLPFEQAVKKAADFVSLCAKTATELNLLNKEGLPVEALLKSL